MPEQEELRVTVTLVDNATAGLAALRTQTQQFSREFQQLTGGHAAAQMESFKRSQGDLAGKIKEVTNVAIGGDKAMLGYIGKFGIAGAAISSFGVLAGTAISNLKAFVEQTAAVADKLKLLSAQPAEFQVLVKQFEQANLGAENLYAALGGLNKAAAAFADPDSPMFKQLRDLAGPQFLETFVKFKEQFEGAQTAGQKLNVVLGAARAFGQSAAEEARQHGANQDTINRRRVEGENAVLDALGQQRELRLLLDRPPLRDPTQAQTARANEMFKNAQQLHEKFRTLEQDMSRLFDFWKTGAAGEKGWLATSIESTDKQLQGLEDNLITLWGTEAQQAELRERRVQQAKEQGRPPPEFPSKAKAAVEVFVGPTRPPPPSIHDYTDPGVLLPNLLNKLVDPIAKAIYDLITTGGKAGQGAGVPQPPALQPPPPGHGGPREIHTQPPQPPLPPPKPDLAEQLGAKSLPPLRPGAAAPAAPQRFAGGGEFGADFPLSTNVEDHRGRLALDDHQRVIGENTAALRLLNTTLSRMTQQPPAEIEGRDGIRHVSQREDFQDRLQPGEGGEPPSLPLAPLPPVPPMRQDVRRELEATGGFPEFRQLNFRVGDDGKERPVSPRLAQDALGRAPTREQLEPEERHGRFRDSDEGSVLRRDDRSELDRRILDFLKPLQVQVEGSGTLTANVTAPAGTRVGLAGGGLFKKTQLNRQTQNVLASTGPPNPAYSPTLEDFPL